MSENLLKKAKELLTQSALVAIPTETVYGLAANAFEADAVTKIFQAKNRPTFDPLIVHTYAVSRVKTFVKELPAKAEKMAEKFWPGPLTLLLPRKDLIPDLVTSGLERVAVRVPDHPLTLELLKTLDFPLAAPSANPFGYISPTTATHVQNQLGDKVSLILDGGASEIGIESTIVGFEGEEVVVYRLGGISIEAIEKVVGKVKIMPHSDSNPSAPGMLKSHYAPRKPFLLKEVQDVPLEAYGVKSLREVGALVFDRLQTQIPPQNQVILSAKGDFAEAAKNLFAGMRRLDSLPVKIILATLLPEKDLGRAINDRLKRAAVQ